MTKARDFSQLATLLAEHTAAPAKAAKSTVVKARQPANDNKPAPYVLAWPALERLAHRGDKARLFALRHWRDLCFPRDVEIPDEAEHYEPEVAIEIRPSETELLGAVGWKVVDRERWAFTGEMVNVYEAAEEVAPKYRTSRNGALEARVGDLLFRDGDLKQWGSTRKGAALQPVERSRGIKGGGTKQGRTETVIWSYIKLKGAVSPLTATPYSKPLSAESAIGDCFTPPTEVVNARKLLTDLGVDGAVPFHALPFPATRCPDGLVAGQQWVGGVKQPKPTASEPAGREPDFVRQVETMDYVDHLRGRLGKHANVLDLAISDASAAEVGIAMGLAPAYAAKRGATLIDEAIDALIDIDETSRGDFAISSAKIAD
ncbi:hypothetical protein HJB96_08795 [Rhizobium sp. NLR15a]|uniref:hypothetical protein n=1 Tax=Rhizobium sp. NLR15a TaxID=2731111 RepID=UPI001C829969|nr:hypothetical protein [Rhizobium sp. NLR15a]MBX5293038.1 hypothetical protein [Rhizobium sp. NLR15a]